jgi:hypothetical protein
VNRDGGRRLKAPVIPVFNVGGPRMLSSSLDMVAADTRHGTVDRG